MAKSYPNTKKGRGSIQIKPAVYNLKNRSKKTVYIGMTKNAHRRIAEHHNNSSKHFASISVSYTSTRKQANRKENSRLKRYNPKCNKKPQ